MRIYKNNSGSWEQVGSDIDGEKKNDYLGNSVSLSGVGSIVANLVSFRGLSNPFKIIVSE